MRHADAGYEDAMICVEHDLNLPMVENEDV